MRRVVQQRLIKIQGNVLWTSRKSTTSSHWIIDCAPLGLSLEADNQEEVPGLINEAMHLFLTDLLADNEFDDFLREQGWRVQGEMPTAPNGVEFDIPWELLVQGNVRDSERRAH